MSNETKGKLLQFPHPKVRDIQTANKRMSEKEFRNKYMKNSISATFGTESVDSFFNKNKEDLVEPSKELRKAFELIKN